MSTNGRWSENIHTLVFILALTLVDTITDWHIFLFEITSRVYFVQVLKWNSDSLPRDRVWWIGYSKYTVQYAKVERLAGRLKKRFGWPDLPYNILNNLWIIMLINYLLFASWICPEKMFLMSCSWTITDPNDWNILNVQLYSGTIWYIFE